MVATYFCLKQVGMGCAAAKPHAPKRKTLEGGVDLYAEPIRMEVSFFQMMVPMIGRIK
jgi:hypothetical protein